MRIGRALVALVLVLGGLLAGSGGAEAATPYCGIIWGSTEKSGGTPSTAPLVGVQTGQQDCWDRVVFEFAGPANGYSVAYGEATTEGQGLPLPPYTAGGALLRVSLRAPAYAGSTTPTVPYRTGDHVANAC